MPRASSKNTHIMAHGLILSKNTNRGGVDRGAGVRGKRGRGAGRGGGRGERGRVTGREGAGEGGRGGGVWDIGGGVIIDCFIDISLCQCFNWFIYEL